MYSMATRTLLPVPVTPARCLRLWGCESRGRQVGDALENRWQEIGEAHGELTLYSTKIYCKDGRLNISKYVDMYTHIDMYTLYYESQLC